MSFYVVQFLNGLASASSLFLIASGLSIIFGVTRIVNFAHGAFYMLGAYLAYSILAQARETIGLTPWTFWGGIVAAALAVGAVGAAVERLLLRRIYRAPELFQLLATFAVVLVIEDLVILLWGPDDLLGPRAPKLRGAVEFLGMHYPVYDLVLIAVGPVVLGALWLLFHRTRFGTLVRAATLDREMVGALGVDQARLFTMVFFLGSALAGLGGAIRLPREVVNPHMDLSVIVDAFVIVVIGGMGSVPGAFLAAVLVSELHAFGILIFPKITLVLLFLVMALVLVVRPWGLLGRPEALARGHAGEGVQPLAPASSLGRTAGGLLLLALAALPLVAGGYTLVVMTEIVIFALFAASLHFIMGNGGMTSFGHAAYFGLGAYGAALFVHHLGTPMGMALVLAPLVAGLGALLFGWFCVRLSGVYLAMLTLAFAQIAWSIAFQWQEVTGGDNGLLGIWPSAWAGDKAVFYLLALLLCGGAIVLMRRIVFAPFGYTLRATRDSALRAEAIGIHVRRHQWLSFALAGTFAGLAGGVFAFSKGSVFPGVLAISTSVDALVMVLLGGLHALAGPWVGAGVFTLLQVEISRMTDYWRLVLGAIIVLLVVAFPLGIVGSVQALAGRWRRA